MPSGRQIQPIILTPGDAEYLSDAAATAFSTARTVAGMVDPMGDRLFALLTDSDDSYTPVRVLWTEQAIDANGQRYTKPSGRSGTATWMPAFAVGGGTLPAQGSWPVDGVEVELRRRRESTDPISGDPMGPVYEFDTWEGSGGSPFGWIKFETASTSVGNNTTGTSAGSITLTDNGYHLVSAVTYTTIQILGSVSDIGADASAVTISMNSVSGGATVTAGPAPNSIIGQVSFPAGVGNQTVTSYFSNTVQWVVQVTGGSYTLGFSLAESGTSGSFASRSASVSVELNAIGPHQHSSP